MNSGSFGGEECDAAVLWRFAECEFDGASRQLRVKGAVVEVESKPIEVLHQLLLHAGEVVTKDELMEAVWPGITVVESSLATAVSKLRRALGDDPPAIVVTVTRVGYRLGVPVWRHQIELPGVQALGFSPGEAVPGREQWQLVRRLDVSTGSEVWLAENRKTHEKRVFKFAADATRLRSLKREATISRLLRESLGERADFVRVLEWNFDTAPYCLESEYGGLNLEEWAEAEGGLAKVSWERRLAILIDTAAAVAAAHDAGVLHKDLKPSNLLVAADGQVRVADFGSGGLAESSRLDAMGITRLGFTSHGDDGLTGTMMYLAPEVLAGQAPTAGSDVYALGVILYQMAAGDFRRPIAPGWENEIADRLIREDIAAAACGDPARRMAGAKLLAESLRRLEERRRERTELDLANARAQTAERRLAVTRARLPWMAAAMLALALGLAGSVLLYGRASRQTAIAAAINKFLADDLLGRSDPFQSGKSGETLADAIRQASPNIDRQFRGEPEIAARLHHAIARALDNRTEFPEARREYERAAELYAVAPDAVIARLQRASMEARTYEKGSLATARSMIEAQESQIRKMGRVREDVAVWLASARGMAALMGNDARTAATQFQAAYDGASKLASFDESARLTFKQRLAFASIRLGDGARAERLFGELIEAFGRANGPESAQVLRVRLNLAQAYMIQNKHREVLRETSAIYPAYLAKLGEDHELTMQVLTTRAQSEGSLGLWPEAIRDDLAIYGVALRKQGPQSFFAIATLSDAALAQCRASRNAEGERNARDAYENSVKAFGARAGLTGGTAYALASCWIGMGRLAEAGKLLQEIDTKVVAELAGIPDWYANVDLAQAEIAYRQGDLAGARKHLETAAPVFQKADAEPYQRRALDELRASVDK
jgi:DNA-binding winged helix-turn-helix (wHTH) protein/serine/threonine protein kinase